MSVPQLSLPVRVTDGWLEDGRQCDTTTQNTEKTLLVLKVFSDIPPEFADNVYRFEVNETVDHLQLEFPFAKDKNNDDPPKDDDWRNQTICYYILQPDPSEKFSIPDPLQSTIR